MLQFFLGSSEVGAIPEGTVTFEASSGFSATGYDTPTATFAIGSTSGFFTTGYASPAGVFSITSVSAFAAIGEVEYEVTRLCYTLTQNFYNYTLERQAMAARQFYTIKKGTNEVVVVDCKGILNAGQTLEGVPSVTVSPSVSGPTISAAAVNTTILSNINGRNVPVGEAVSFFVTTSGADPKKYTLKIIVNKTGSPVPTRIEDIYLRVIP